MAEECVLRWLQKAPEKDLETEDTEEIEAKAEREVTIVTEKEDQAEREAEEMTLLEENAIQKADLLIEIVKVAMLWNALREKIPDRVTKILIHQPATIKPGENRRRIMIVRKTSFHTIYSFLPSVFYTAIVCCFLTECLSGRKHPAPSVTELHNEKHPVVYQDEVVDFN